VNVVIKKLQIQEENHLSKSYSINGVAIVEEGDPGDLYLVMNLDGIDIKQIFSLFFFYFKYLSEWRSSHLIP
jgi:hypothetical protein